MRLLFWACYLVLLCFAASVALAEPPPKSLLAHVGSQQLVHNQLCDFRDMKAVECLVFVDLSTGVVWMVLFDKEMEISHVVEFKDKKSEVVWCRQDVCV